MESIDKIKCTKPKKVENTYVCQIQSTAGAGTNKLVIPFNNSKIIQIKHAFQPGDYMIYIKNKQMRDYLYDLNTYIVDYTRKHCSEWFGNNMNPELLEDYFSNPLVYVKNHGDIIKLKCINSPNINDLVDKVADLEICITNLRFYKQKFMYECKVLSATASYADIKTVALTDDFDDEEDLPEPSEDEINILREDYYDILGKKLQVLQMSKATLEEDLANVVDSLAKVNEYLYLMDSQKNIPLQKILEIGSQLEDL